MYDTFISYSSADEGNARTVYNFLRANSINPFFAAASLPASARADFGDAIDEALVEVSNFVLVVSSAANIEAGYVQSEMASVR